MPRGGRRTGTPGQAYANRSDLNTNHTLPIAAAPGQPYGQAGQQLAAQHAVPLASTPSPPVPAAPPSPPAQAPPVLPGTLTPLSAPTTQPHVPLTSGIDSGPGQGSAALGLASPANLAQLVRQAASGPNATPDVAALAAFLESGSL